MIKWNEYTWYSKALAFIFLVLLLPVWTFYLGTQYENTRQQILEEQLIEYNIRVEQKHQLYLQKFYSGTLKPPQPSQPTPKPTVSSEATYPPKIPPLASSTKIHVLVSQGFVLSGTTTAPGIQPSKYGIKIEVIANKEESGTAIFGDAYLNGKEIAQGIPVYSTFEGTSPDLTYYAYRSLSHASAGSSFIGIQVFNQHTEEHTHIGTPPGESASKYISDSGSESWYRVLPYIESYAWKDVNSINFIFFYFAWETGERVSPRQIWNYDLITKKYTLTSAEE